MVTTRGKVIFQKLYSLSIYSVKSVTRLISVISNHSHLCLDDQFMQCMRSLVNGDLFTAAADASDVDETNPRSFYHEALVTVWVVGLDCGGVTQTTAIGRFRFTVTGPKARRGDTCLVVAAARSAAGSSLATASLCAVTGSTMGFGFGAQRIIHS